MYKQSCLFVHITCKQNVNHWLFIISKQVIYVYTVYNSIYLYITLYRYFYNESKEKILKDLVSSLRYWPHPRKWYMERADQVSGTAAFAFDHLNWPESKPVLSCFFFSENTGDTVYSPILFSIWWTSPWWWWLLLLLLLSTGCWGPFSGQALLESAQVSCWRCDRRKRARVGKPGNVGPDQG